MRSAFQAKAMTTMELTTSTPRPLHWSLLFTTALLVTLLLYFIDEGRYSLEGLLTVGNGIAMVIHFAGHATGAGAHGAIFATRHPSRSPRCWCFH